MKLSISMTPVETFAGWGYFLFSTLILPSLLQLGNAQLVNPLSEGLLNIVFFVLNFLVVVLLFRRFLIASVKSAVRTPWKCLRFAALGLFLYYLATTLVSYVILYVDPEFANVNDAAIKDMSQGHFTLMSFCTILLVPITEETFFRGLLFQGLQRRSRVWAYIVSTVLFSAIHIFGYIGLFDLQTLFLCFLQYLPAGLTLGFAYEKADTIAAPILMHIAINQIGMSAMR